MLEQAQSKRLTDDIGHRDFMATVRPFYVQSTRGTEATDLPLRHVKIPNNAVPKMSRYQVPQLCEFLRTELITQGRGSFFRSLEGPGKYAASNVD